MMSCENSQRLSALLDGELSPVETTRLEQHVAGCGKCAMELDGLRAVDRLMAATRDSDMGQPSQIAMARLRKHVEGLLETADNGLLWIARVFSGVAASVLIGGIWLLNQAPRPVMASPNWERVAVTLSIDPTPRSAPDLKLPESVLADLAGRDVAEVELP